MSILITGSNRGVGLALTKKHLQANATKIVSACCRKPSQELLNLAEQYEQLNIIEGCEIADDNIGQYIKEQLDIKGIQSLELLINNAGILNKETLQDFSLETMRKQFEINTLGPLKITHALLPLLKGPALTKVAMITSRMGSVNDNTSGGAYGYRMSKSALNMGTMSMSHDLKQENIAFSVIHPGYVQTDMTGGSGHINTKESAEGIFDVITKTNLENTGSFWHSNGEALPW